MGFSYSSGTLTVTGTESINSAFAAAFNGSPSATPYAAGTYIERLIGGPTKNDTFLSGGAILYRQSGGFNVWSISSGATLTVDDDLVINLTSGVRAFNISGALIVGRTLDNLALQDEIGGTVRYYPPRGSITVPHGGNVFDSPNIVVDSSGSVALNGGCLKLQTGALFSAGSSFSTKNATIYLGRIFGENTFSSALIIKGSVDVDGVKVYGGGYDGTQQGSFLTRVFPLFTSGTFRGYEPIGIAYPITSIDDGGTGTVTIEGYNPRFSAGDFYPFYNTTTGPVRTFILKKPVKLPSAITWVAFDNVDPLFPGDSNAPQMRGLGIIQGSISATIASTAGSPLSDGLLWVIDTNNSNRSATYIADQSHKLVPSSGVVSEQLLNLIIGDKPTSTAITLDNRGPFLVSARVWGYRFQSVTYSIDQLGPGLTTSYQLIADARVTGSRATALELSDCFDADQNITISADSAGVAPQSLFATPTPGSSDTDGDYELGFAFTANQNCKLTKFRYYKMSGDTGTHTGKLWSAGGTLLASQVFTSETSSGWQEVTLSSPYSLVSGTNYVISTNTATANYPFTTGGLSSPISTSNTLITTLFTGGRFNSTPGSFPATTSSSSFLRDATVTIPAVVFADPTPQELFNGLVAYQLDNLNPRVSLLGDYNPTNNTLDLDGQELTLPEPLTNPGSISQFDKLTLQTAGDYSSIDYKFKAACTLVLEEAGNYILSGSSTFVDGAIIEATGIAVTINAPDNATKTHLDANKSELSGATITITAPQITFSASGIGASGTFNSIRCRTSFYKRATFPTTDVSTTTNRITISGLSGRISNNSYVRFYGTDLPAPLDQNNRYFIHDFSGNAFSLSSTQGGGGTQIDLTDAGSGDMIAIILTELDIQLVTDGSYEFSLSSAQSTAGITLSTNDQLLFQAVHWAGSLQSVDPPIASKYHEELQVYSGASISTLAQLQPYAEHNTFAIQENTDGYEISQLTVTGSSPTRYQWRVDASAPGLVQIESEDPDRVISSAAAVLYFQFVQWTATGIRLFRGEIEAENLNSIVIASPEVGTNAVLTVESFPTGVPLLVNGPGMYRADGKTWIATGSPIQHQPTALVAVPIPVEVPINLSGPVMNMLHTMLAALTVQADASSGGGGLTAQQVANALKLAPAAGSPAEGSVYSDLDEIKTIATAAKNNAAAGL